MQNDKNAKTPVDKREKNHKIIDGMDSICEVKGPEAKRRSQYYNSFDYKMTDPQGSYTGVPTQEFGYEPVQDADDL